MDGCTCGGSGIVEKGGKLYECICALLLRRAASMPPYVRIAELRAEHLSYGMQDQVRKSVLIIAAWQDVKAIVKAVMIKHVNLFVRVTSDNDILHAYVGDMSKKSKGENEATFENVGDYIGPPDLAIIRLNAIVHPNKAAAGALEEALVVRNDQDKPTWFVSDIGRPFVSGSPAYSESLWDLMEALPRIRVAPILSKAETPMDAPSTQFDIEVLNDRSAESRPRKQGKSKKAEAGGNDLSMYGAGVKKKGSFGRGDD